MANFTNTVLTTAGLALYTKAQSGTQINFTRLQVGSSQLQTGQDMTTFTALITPISYFPVNSVSSSGNTAHIKGIFENTNVNESTYLCEIGLFATDPDVGEILFAYGNAGTQGDTIPPISVGPFSDEYQFNVAIGNATNVTATISSDTYIPATDKGVAGGIASLGPDGYVLSAQLPVGASGSPGIVDPTSFVGKAIISENQPNAAGSDDGRLLWFKGSTNETKLYVNGQWRSISAGAPTFNKTRNSVTLNAAASTVAHGLTNFVADRDFFFVHKGTSWLQETTDFVISSDGLSIVSTGSAWPAGEIFDFLAIQPSSVPTSDTLTLSQLEYTQTGTAGQTNVPIGISDYNSTYDTLEVYLQNVRLNKTEHWTLNANKTSIDLVGFSLDAGEKVTFVVRKKVRDGAPVGTIDGSQTLIDGSVSRGKLAVDVQTSLGKADSSVQTGANNQTVNKIKAINAKVDTRSTSLTYTGGQLTQVLEQDAGTTVKTTNLTYTNGQLTQVQEIVGGSTITTTLNYNGDGTLASTSKAVS